MLRRNADALLATRLQLAPPAHSAARRQPDLPVVLGQVGKVTFPLVAHCLVAVVVDQAHFSLLVAS
jgi:hypothetical protein